MQRGARWGARVAVDVAVDVEAATADIDREPGADLALIAGERNGATAQDGDVQNASGRRDILRPVLTRSVPVVGGAPACGVAPEFSPKGGSHQAVSSPLALAISANSAPVNRAPR